MENINSIEILIVEDNPYDAELIIRSLRKINFGDQIYVAEDGAKALDFIFCKGNYSHRDFAKPPKAIFLDLKLPKINGLDVLQEIKSNSQTKALPVVMLTSSREDSDLSKAYDLGINSYVVKPVNFDNFLSTLSQTGLYWLQTNEAQEEKLIQNLII